MDRMSIYSIQTCVDEEYAISVKRGVIHCMKAVEAGCFQQRRIWFGTFARQNKIGQSLSKGSSMELSYSKRTGQMMMQQA